MIQEIVKLNEKRISKDINEIDGIKNIDFIDIFPISEEHRVNLDNEASTLGKLIDSTEKGNFYLLNKPIKTRWGNLKFIKIRFFDESKLHYEAAPDFELDSWENFLEIAQANKRYSFINREKWKAIEFKTENCLVYFLNPLITQVYDIKD